MKESMVLIGWLLFAAVAHAQGAFVHALSASDFTSAGLQKQTPAELARLELLVERYKSSGALAAVGHHEQKTEVVEAAIKGTEARPPRISAPSAAKKQPGWLTAILTLNRAAEKPEEEESLESRLVGDFVGWNGRTVFELENDTRWVQQNKDDFLRYSPALHGPRVVIKPASLNGFWLEIEGVNKRLRVLSQPRPK